MAITTPARFAEIVNVDKVSIIVKRGNKYFVRTYKHPVKKGMGRLDAIWECMYKSYPSQYGEFFNN